MKIDLLGYALIILILGISYCIYNESDYFNLKCIVSDVDGRKYCVRERKKLHEAADRLAKATQAMTTLVKHCKAKFPDDERVKRLVEGYNPKKIVEILPTSKYTAYSQNKGEKLAFCLNTEKNGDRLIDLNTLTFVALHELSHVATKEIGHTPKFWQNFKFLLDEAVDIGIYKPVNYNKKPRKYCSMMITDNPYYSLSAK